MSMKPFINGGAANAALETTLAVEQFLNENYRFRRNVLNGKVEFAIKSDDPADDQPQIHLPDDS